MEKTTISAEEFIALYTGHCKSFDCVVDGVKKIFGFTPYAVQAADCAKIFRKYIKLARFDLAKAVYDTGASLNPQSRNYHQQIDLLIKKFTAEIGSETIEFETMSYNDNDCENECSI